MNNFNNLGLDEKFIQNLSSMEISAPTEIQEKAIPILLNGKDLVGLSQTGTGKTLAFVLPILQKMSQEKFVQTLIICPTRELAEQIVVETRKVLKGIESIRTIAIYGGSDMQRQIFNLRKGANLVVGTPGRILDHINRKTLKLGMIHTVVLDEADEMLNMGFRQDIEEILRSTPKTRQTVMFSATMSPDIMKITRDFMVQPETLQIGSPNATISKIKQTYYLCSKDKKKRALQALLGELPRERTLVFCNTKRMVDSVQLYLRNAGFSALALHGDMPQNVRKRVMGEYKDTPNNLLVTTDVAARGIDVKDIMNVINFDLPQNDEYYIHRVGRTGRAGKSGNAYTLLNSASQINDLYMIERKTKSTITQGNFDLPGTVRVNPNEINDKAPRSKKLNIKSREQRGSGSRKTEYGKPFERKGKFGNRSYTEDNSFGSKSSRGYKSKSNADNSIYGQSFNSDDNQIFGSKSRNRNLRTTNDVDYANNSFENKRGRQGRNISYDLEKANSSKTFGTRGRRSKSSNQDDNSSTGKTGESRARDFENIEKSNYRNRNSKFSKNSKSFGKKSNSSYSAKISISGKSKLGTKTRTIRQTHKSKKQNSK